jgi:hypothetical protein
VDSGNAELAGVPEEGGEVKMPFSHYDTGVELEQSYQRGCHLCTLIWQACLNPSGKAVFKMEKDVSNNLRELRGMRNLVITTCSPPTYRQATMFWLVVSIPLVETQRGFDFYLKQAYISVNTWPPEPWEEGMQTSDLPLANFPAEVLAASCSVSTASDACLELARQWISTSHEKWKTHSTPSVLPTRLLKADVAGSGQHPRLVLTSQMSSDIQYVALSYCWGATTGIRLIASTMNVLRTGLPIEAFPKTIQDAIKVTRKLGFEWLWVDSLCIMQDSVEDWRREAGSMVDIYQNGSVCIAAVGAPSAEHGLFSQRDPLTHVPCRLFRSSAGKEVFAFHKEISNQLNIFAIVFTRRRFIDEGG